MFHVAWLYETTRALLLSEFDERFRRHRLLVPEVGCALADSLKRCGEMAPVVPCVFGERFVRIVGIATRPNQSAGELALAKFNKRRFLSVIEVDTS